MLLYIALIVLLLAFIAAITHPLALLLNVAPVDATGLLSFLSAARNFIADLLFWGFLASLVIMLLIIARERLTGRKAVARPTSEGSRLTLGKEAGATLTKMAVALTAYDDAEAIGKAVEDFRSQEGVVEVIVIDNNSRDNTGAVATAAGARVVRETQQGYGYACIRGLREALKVPEAGVIVLCEGDGTFVGADLAKFGAYIGQADMVIGTRVVGQLVEERSQMDTFFTWGNVMAGTFLRLKFWN
ncbi:MAG: glycosyltransferase [Dehalococcoidia bacterium]